LIVAYLTERQQWDKLSLIVEVAAETRISRPQRMNVPST
jgi:hypothetical protein